MKLSIRSLAATTGVAGAIAVALGYLTVGTATTQQRNISAVNRANRDAVTDRVTDYGLSHGRWDGVQQLVASLSVTARMPIRITTEAGVRLADTGVSSGRTAGPAIRINPGPQFFLLANQKVDGPAIALSEIRKFRRDAAIAACLSAAGVEVDSISGQNGIPTLKASAGTPAPLVEQVRLRCPGVAQTSDDLMADTAALHRCVDPATSRVGPGCLGRAFAERTARVTADPVLLFVSAARAESFLAITPLVGLIAAFMILAWTGTAIAGRSLFLEITGASRRAVEGADDQVAQMSRYVDKLAMSIRQKEEEQRQRIAAVTHELRTPLANIRAYLEGLSEGVILPRPELFASLHDEAMLQQRIIDDLRGDDTLGGETGYGADVDLAELVKATCNAQRPAAEAAGLRLMLDVAGWLPVTGDPDRLRQVIGNLVSNALRYTPAGGAVEVRTRNDDGRAVLQVVDTGIGIAEQDLPRVFDRQWRSDAARSLVVDGSGLGLSIVRKFVVDHGGAVFVDSRPGLGTAFTVVLPLARLAMVEFARRGLAVAGP